MSKETGVYLFITRDHVITCSCRSLQRGFCGQACGHKYVIPQSINCIKPIIYMHQSSTELSFFRRTLHSNTGTCCCFNSRVVSQHLVWCRPSYQDECPDSEHIWSLRYQFLAFFNAGIFCGKFCNCVCKEWQLQTVFTFLIFKYMQCCIVRSIWRLVVKFLKMLFIISSYQMMPFLYIVFNFLV